MVLLRRINIKYHLKGGKEDEKSGKLHVASYVVTGMMDESALGEGSEG